jgi:KUP system potassium uptake protein
MKGVLGSLGLVFGDIGTSPIYTLTVIILLTKPDEAHIMGVLSLIVWTLITLISAQYAWLAMSLSRKGEGGDIVLREILVHLLKGGRKARFVTLVSYVSVSLMIGDGVITPAISILSAMEGARLIPGLAGLTQLQITLASCAVAVVLVSVQRYGTDKVAGAFGPVMVLWFLALSVSGIFSITTFPGVLNAVNPYYAFKLLSENGLVGFIILSEVILCATGGEALYADMGHIGAKPIIKAWFFVFAALFLSYMGQGAFVITHPEAKNALFEMIFSQSAFLYAPFLVLSLLSTVIASQAMISGMFSIVYQGIFTGMFPRLRIDFTSTKLRSQIYIGFVNWFLLASVLFVMFQFGESSKLAAAYGLAVSGAMTVTGSMMTWIFFLRGDYGKSSVALVLTLIDLAFLLSCGTKIPHGGYWSLVIASAPLTLIMVYTLGQRKLYRAMRPVEGDFFVGQYKALYSSSVKLKGTALYFTRDTDKIPPYIIHTMFINGILYEDNIFISINTLDVPFGMESYFRGELSDGLRIFEIHIGYLEPLDLADLLRKSGINEKTIFYGIEDIVTTSPVWSLFSAIKKLSPTYVQFYKLPPNKLHGVVTRVEM